MNTFIKIWMCRRVTGMEHVQNKTTKSVHLEQKESINTEDLCQRPVKSLTSHILYTLHCNNCNIIH